MTKDVNINQQIHFSIYLVKEINPGPNSKTKDDRQVLRKSEYDLLCVAKENKNTLDFNYNQ